MQNERRSNRTHSGRHCKGFSVVPGIIIGFLAALIDETHRLRDQNNSERDQETAEEKLFARRQATRTTRATVITAVATVVIAAASLLTFGAAVLQYWVFKGQLGEMQSTGRQMDAQIAEMKAQRLLTVAQLRANMRRDAITIQPLDERGKIIEPGTTMPAAWNISPHWTNVGGTEARNYKGWFDIIIGPVAPVINNRYVPKCPNLTVPDPLLHPRTVVGRDGGTTHLAKQLKKEDALKAIEPRPTAFIYIVGHIEYADIFPDSSPHHNDWCVVALPVDIEKSIFSFVNIAEETY
jgi:hypothetical protein